MLKVNDKQKILKAAIEKTTSYEQGYYHNIIS